MTEDQQQLAAATSSSVGVVVPQRFVHNQAFKLHHGDTLPEFELVFETYGRLNPSATNAVLICHALSGHHHAAGLHNAEDKKPGWWDACIGPDKAIDTNRFFVVSVNNLGGCHGSTGPQSVNPQTGKEYGPDFPTVVVQDWIRSQKLLAEHLNIEKFAAVIGGSLGGMQALQWAIDYPDCLHAALLIASAAKLTAQNIAFNEIARHAISSDPKFHEGHYRLHSANPDEGLMLARMIGHVTYLSDDGMAEKFGREIKSGNLDGGADIQFQVESYLHHQGRSFSQMFDANTYILMTRALDYFDPAHTCGDNLLHALNNVKAKFLVVSFSSDWRFSVERSKEIVDALIAARKQVVSTIIESDHGHDSFLLPLPRYISTLKTYLDRVYSESVEQANA